MDHPVSTSGARAGIPPPTATSRDGRSVGIVAEVGAPGLTIGGIVVAGPDGADPVLCQVLEVDADGMGGERATGSGTVLGTLTPGGLDRRARPAFSASPVTAADPGQISALQQATGATMEVGRWHAGGADAPAALRPAGFNRHTFLCGQSGSGKTYALGVLLERLLLATDLRVAILDPNADFTRLGETLDDVDAEEAEGLGRRKVRVLARRAAIRSPLARLLLLSPSPTKTAGAGSAATRWTTYVHRRLDRPCYGTAHLPLVGHRLAPT